MSIFLFNIFFWIKEQQRSWRNFWSWHYRLVLTESKWPGKSKVKWLNNFSFQMRYGVCDLKSESWTDLQRDNTRKIMKHRVKNVTQHMVTIGTFLYIRSITKGADWRRKQRWQTVRQILKHLRISSPKAEADSQHSIESITHATTYHLTLTRSIWNKLQHIFSFTLTWMEKIVFINPLEFWSWFTY